MKKVSVVLFLVSSVYVSGVYSALGYPFDVPNLSGSVSSAIGSGVTPLLDLQKASQVNVNVDRTGTIGVLQLIIGNATEPLNSLLTKLRVLTVSKSTDQKDTFQQVGWLYGNLTIAMGNATTYTLSLANRLKPIVYSDINSAISYFNFTITDAKPVAATVQSALALAAQANPPVTASTISNYVTSDLVNSVSSKIAAMMLGINRLTTALQTALSLRNTAINYQANTNQTIKSAISDTNSLLVNVNTKLDSTRNSITQAGKSFTGNLNSTFVPITSNPFNWNNGNIANLTSFLANFTSLVQVNFTQSLDAGITYAKINISSVVMNQTSWLSQVVFNASANISDTGSMNFSSYADGCVSKYNGMLMSSPMSLTRLNDCVRLESGVPGIIDSYAQQAISKAKHDAIKSYNQLEKCYEKNGACAMAVSRF